MSRSVHFIAKGIPGYGPPDGGCFPCSGVSGRALGISPNSSRGDYKLISDVKFLNLKCVPKRASPVCNASSGSYRRNQDFSRQNRNGFSRHRNRHNEERDSYEHFDESETFSSKNGPLLSVSANQKFQATSTPGPREKEIVELFRKVQAQLRERAAIKEARRVEDPKGKSKDSETVDSLLKLLRKHSVQQGKKNTNISSNRDFILDQPEQGGASTMKHDILESSSPNLARPKSNFRKRSPVPEIKFQPVYPDESVNSVSLDNLDGRRKGINLEPETDDIDDVDPAFSEENLSDEMPDDETSESFESEHDDVAEKQNIVETSSLSGMKLTELRALAKSRGLKGFSKLKKSELVELLSVSSI